MECFNEYKILCIQVTNIPFISFDFVLVPILVINSHLIILLYSVICSFNNVFGLNIPPELLSIHIKIPNYYWLIKKNMNVLKNCDQCKIKLTSFKDTAHPSKEYNSSKIQLNQTKRSIVLTGYQTMFLILYKSFISRCPLDNIPCWNANLLIHSRKSYWNRSRSVWSLIQISTSGLVIDYFFDIFNW